MSSNGRIRTEHAVMGICVILRLHGTIRMNVKAVRQLVTKDAAKLLTISWGTMPKWIRRPGVLVVGIIDQGLRMNPGENGRRHSQIDLDERGKANFERYNRLLSCLYPQLDSYHLDLYINVTGIVSRSVEEVLKLTEEVDCFLTFHEGREGCSCERSRTNLPC